MYIKDVSFLSFPTYYVYITGQSPMWGNHESFKEIYNISSTTNLRNIYSNLAGSSEQDLQKLIKYIEAFISSPEILEEDKNLKWLRAIFRSKISKEYVVAPEYLLALLYLKLGNYEESYRKMDALFKRYDLKREDQKYLFAFRDALFLLSKKYRTEDIEKILSNYYNKDYVATAMCMLIIADIKLMAIKVPKPSDYVYYEGACSIFEKISKKVEASSIDQYGLRDYFYE